MTNYDTALETQHDIRILVADDYEINQELALLILQNAGYQVEVVENGLRAVETYQNDHFDLILMDIRMPLMDGYEATKRIRIWESGLRPGEGIGAHATDGKQNSIGNNSNSISKIRMPHAKIKQVPIIAMTGDAAESVYDTCLKIGMNDCVGKPLQRDQLLSVVKEWSVTGSKMPQNYTEIANACLTPQTFSDNQPPLDLDKAIKDFLGKRNILFGALETFIDSVKQRIVTIRHACSVNDHETIAAAAHGIKGGAANLTANQLADLASQLEEAAGRPMPEQVGDLVDRIEEQFRQLEQYFHQNCIL